MSEQIESKGAYRGEITEATLDFTKKGYPQAILRLEAKEKFLTDQAEVDYFVKAGKPCELNTWFPWNFGQSKVAFLVLYNSAEEFSPQTELLNAKQLEIATGWDRSGDAFSNNFFIGKTILFRCEEDTYEGKTTLKVNWIDAFDASPERSLKAVTPDAVKAFNSKLRGFAKNVTVVSAPKPLTIGPDKWQPVAIVTVPSASNPALAAAAPVASPASPPKRKGRPASPVAAPTATVQGPALPAETTKADAWKYVNENKGKKDDTDVVDAWMTVSESIGPEEDSFTGSQWSAVRDGVMERLSK